MIRNMCIMLFCFFCVSMYAVELFQALLHNDQVYVKQMLEHDPELAKTPIDEMHMPLDVAILRHNLDMVTMLVSYGADVNRIAQNRYAKSPLHIAISQYQDLLRNDQDADQHTITNMRNIIRFLLTSGADVNAPMATTDTTPIYSAVETQDADLVYLVLRYGASVQVYNYRHNTPLHRAESNQRILQLLLEYGAYDTYDSDGRNLLACLISSHRDVQMARIMLQYGSEPYDFHGIVLLDEPVYDNKDVSHEMLFACYGLIVSIPAFEDGDISQALSHIDVTTAGCMALGQGYRDIAQQVYERYASESQQLDILLHAHVLFNLSQENRSGRRMEHISDQIHQFVHENTTDNNIPSLLYRMADELHHGRLAMPHVRQLHQRYASYMTDDLAKKIVSDCAQRLHSHTATLGEIAYIIQSFPKIIRHFRDTTQSWLISFCTPCLRPYLSEMLGDYVATGRTLLHDIAENDLFISSAYALTIAKHIISPACSPYTYRSQTPLDVAREHRNSFVERMLLMWRILVDCDVLCQSRGTRSHILKRLLHTMLSEHPEAHHPCTRVVYNAVTDHSGDGNTCQGLPREVREHILEFALDPAWNWASSGTTCSSE